MARLDSAGEASLLRPGRWRLHHTRHNYNVRLNGASTGLADIDERIYITNIRETVKEDVTIMDKARYDGQWPMVQSRSSLEVTIQLMIKEESPEQRRQVTGKIIAWCEDGAMRISSRPNQFLVGTFVKYPLGKMQAWTDKLELVFTAYGLPYWQEDEMNMLRFQMKNGSTAITPKGNTEYCYMEFTATNVEDTEMTSLMITTGLGEDELSVMYLPGISVKQGESVKVYYDLMHKLHVTAPGTDYANRSIDSSDDLILVPRKSNTLTISASRECKFEVSARGLFK